MAYKLAELAEKPARHVVGLMSGTSMDGVDAALVRIEGNGPGLKAEVMASETLDYPPDVPKAVQTVVKANSGTAQQICRLNFRLGQVFADAVRFIAEKANLPIEQVDLIGSHGQTICHLPPRKGAKGSTISLTRLPSTLQIGEADVIAELTGVTVVSDFRKRDMAAGGQGAPLVPYVDYLLFHHPDLNRVLINIGGISNLTCLEKGAHPEHTLAFDTGPGNMMIDGLVQIVTMGRQRYDKDGEMARKGQVDGYLMQQLMSHAFLQEEPPKSTGREEFGEEYTREFYELGVRRGVKPSDLVATATTFTARALAQSVRQFIVPKYQVDEYIVSGGGALNPYLMAALLKELGEINLHSSDEFGMPIKGKEAVAFAILANETLCLAPSNLPSATGASGYRILGKITPA